MSALAQIDLGALTPEQCDAAVQAIAALETLRAENEMLAADKACLAVEKDALADRNETQAARIRRLEHLNLELIRLLYGKRSEKLSADERQLAFEELEGAAAEVEAEASAGDPSPPRSPKRPRAERNIGHLPEHLERIEQVIEPESTLCPCGCGEMVRIGEDRAERLDIVPAQLRVIVTVRPKYACRSCEQGVTQALAPAWLIEGGLPTEGAIAHVLVSKYAEHCPLYRQAQIYARSGLELDRSTLAGWVGKASFHLRPVADRLAAHLKRSSKLFMDETRAPVLDPGRGRTRTGWLWALARDDRAWGGPDPPGVMYFYAPGRGGEHAERFLDGFDGILQVDGYAGHNRLGRADRPGGALTLAACWIHARRGLKEVFDSNGSPIAEAGLERIAQLYRIEDRIRGELPATRQFVRWTEAAALVNAFGVWLDEQRSRLGEKFTYIANQWDRMLVFLYDGRVEMDSNFVENRIRPVKLTAKNALFAGHDEGARSWGRIASLIEICRMNGVEPCAWLKSTLEKIAAGHPQSKIHELLP